MEISKFRDAFPEFKDPAVYPDSRIAFWSGVAERSIDRDRWDQYDLYDHGIMLLVAHYLTLAHNAATLGTGGSAVGLVSSESQSADGLSWSESRDTSAYASAGQLGTTMYGQQYIDLCRIIGLAEGARQL